MLERRHCHPLYIVEKLYSILVAVALYVFYGIAAAAAENDSISAEDAVSEAAGGPGVLGVVLGALGLLAVVVFIIWIGWYNTWISAKDNTLILESGVFVKKRLTIPFSKINTIDMGRNVFQRIVGTCRLKIDTGAVENGAEEKSEINLVFSLKEAEEFRSYILNRAEQDENDIRMAGGVSKLDAGAVNGNVVQAKFTDFLLYGMTSSGVWKLVCVIITVALFVGEISASILERAGEILLPAADRLWTFIISSGIIMAALYIFLMFVMVTLVSNFMSVIYAAIRYYGFSVTRDRNNIVVRYGLISIKNYTIPAENVHAVVVRSNLFQQMIGLCSVEMVSIGYGNEEKETNLLFPSISKNKLPWLLEQILPEYSLSKAEYKPGKRSVRFLIVRPIVWYAVILAAIVACCGLFMDSLVLPGIAAAIILAAIVIRSILQYRNNALGCDGKVMLVRSGGLNDTTHLIRVDAVQSISATTGFFQRRRGVASYRVDFHAPALRSIAVVSHLDKDIHTDNLMYILD